MGNQEKLYSDDRKLSKARSDLDTASIDYMGKTISFPKVLGDLSKAKPSLYQLERVVSSNSSDALMVLVSEVNEINSFVATISQ